MPTRTSTKPAPPQIEAAGLRTFHSGLLKWYKTHGRHALPWRKTSDPYAIWVSEVMLQQTQVSTVLNKYYFPFLEKFPTVQALAKAPRERVLKAWEGLGYYRRAGFLHEAAKRAHNNMPDDLEGLLALPGIGRNTAHAIMAFAHKQPLPVMEANVKRIVARVFALKQPKEEQLWQGAFALLNKKRSFDHNQAMMDLGNMVCTPRNAHCTICPANTICEGKHAPEQYPAPKAKKQVPVRRVAISVREDAAGRYYLETRKDALLGGLYGFPQSAKSAGKKLGNITHTYSHFKLEGAVHHQRSNTREKGDGWFSREEIAALPLSRADHKVLELLRHTAPKK